MNKFRQSLLREFNMDLNIVKATGWTLFDENNTAITDCFAQYGVLSLGHNYPPIKQAIFTFIEQDSPNFIQPLGNHASYKLTESLLGQFNGEYSHVGYGNSGAEAVEASIKLARIHTSRKKILSLRQGYHGKTFAALSASGSSYYKKTYIHDQEDFYHVDIEDLQQIESLLRSRKFAAFIYEPVLGEGGMRELDRVSLKKIEDIAKETQTLCIADEIQCGLGRCGAISYAKQQQLQPDMILFSKSLSGGFVPISCFIYKENLYSKIFEKIHSSTFAANGFAAICAQIVIERLSNPNDFIIANVKNLSITIDDRKAKIENKYGHICEISGVGLLRGIHFNDEKAKQNYCLKYLYNSNSLAFIISSYLYNNNNLLTMPLLSSKTSIRFQPPLIVTIDVINKFFDAIEEICLLIDNGRYDVLFGVLLKSYQKPDNINYKYPAINSNAPIAPGIQPNTSGKKFAFFMHPTTRDSLIFVFPKSILKQYNKSQQIELADKFLSLAKLDPHPEVSQELSVFANNSSASGVIISSSLLPTDLISMKRKDRRELLQDYLDIAIREKAQVIGLGAYTSIISRSGDDIKEMINDSITLTTGNSFTALSVIHSINEYFKNKPKNR
ncbi:MAG: aminotransferase class III-fold pyridoxal phosphate-dependent enzyme, partial [Legionellales bacterium]|nr:aminotransferase class III-fold pyridoxal phosphate-dependent enzyme [Legionellales bacterium]